MTGPPAAHAVSGDTAATCWSVPLADREFDRCPELRLEEAEALKALSPLEMRRNRARGVPRRAAGHWKALVQRRVSP